jgi:beta-lactamase regulating signal transducer with metallopeptidase domain
MNDVLFAGGTWLLPLAQGTACLAVGLAASHALRHRPARAHQVLLTAMLASVLMPGLYLSASHFGLGILAPRAAPSRGTPALGGGSFPAGGGWATGTSLFFGLPAAETADEALPPRAEPIVATPAPPAAPRAVPWSVIPVVGWAVAAVLLLLRVILRFILGVHVVHAARPWNNEQTRHALETAKNKLRIDKPIQVRCSKSIRSPVIWCWSRTPVLLVPEDASHAGDPADWTGVFCHEFSHWRRRDHIAGLLAELLVAVLPWHPLLWWAKGRLLQLSEEACDDWVLATGQSGVDYAEILLGLAAERQMAFVPTVIGKERTMNMRIRRIIQDNGSDPRIGTRWALAVGVLAVCMTVGVAVAQKRPAGLEPMDPPPGKELKEPGAANVREDPGAAAQRKAVERMLEQLTKQAQQKKTMLGKSADLPEEERQVQQIELKLLTEQIDQMQHRLEMLGSDSKGKPGGKEQGKPGKPGAATKFEPLRQRHEELAQMAQKVERELAGLKDGQDAEAKELKLRLKKLHAEMADVDKQLGSLKGKKEPAKGTPDRKDSNVKDDFKGGKKPGEASPAIEKKKGGPGGNPRLEAEVEDLRSQMKDMRGQMQQMQELLKQTMERGQADTPAKK